MFPERHYMDGINIAYVLRAEDVGDFFKFSLSHPTLHSNPIEYWQYVANRNMGGADDRLLVGLATSKVWTQAAPKGKGRRV